MSQWQRVTEMEQRAAIQARRRAVPPVCGPDGHDCCTERLFQPRQSSERPPRGWLPWCFSAPPTHREPQLPVRVYRRGRFEPDGYLGLICAHRPYQSSLCCLEPQGPRCEVRKRASRFGTVEASDTTLLGLAVTVRSSLINPHRFGGADKHQSRNAP